MKSIMNMWHGSPSLNVVFDNRTAYFTSNHQVACDYAKGKVALTGKVVGKRVPTVYKCRLSVNIFDLRKANMRDLYTGLRSIWNKQADEDSQLPRLDSEGFIMSGTGLPGYGNTPLLREAFAYLHLPFNATMVDDGSHGISLAVFDPGRTVRVLETTAV